MCILRPLALSFGVLLAAASACAGEFPLKDGDVWVMAGDSITAQHLHSNDFEAFCFAPCAATPQKLHFELAP